MNLGGWSNLGLIDLGYMRSLYPELPPGVEKECKHYRPDGNELQPYGQAAYRRLLGGLRRRTDESVANSNAPHHGPNHFANTERRGMYAFMEYQRRSGRHFPKIVGQIFRAALYSHDACHQGCAFRRQVLARGALIRPEFGTDVGVEWVTSVVVNEWLKEAGVSLPARLLVIGTHWDSTFGGNAPLGQELGIPTPKPTTITGCIMRAADVCPPQRVEDIFDQSLRVNHLEDPAFEPATTWLGFLEGELRFLDYVIYCFDELDRVAELKPSLTEMLGWRKRVVSHKNNLTRLLEGKHPRLEEHARKKLAEYNVALTG